MKVTLTFGIYLFLKTEWNLDYVDSIHFHGKIPIFYSEEKNWNNGPHLYGLC